jgi:hypothetical protein
MKERGNELGERGIQGLSWVELPVKWSCWCLRCSSVVEGRKKDTKKKDTARSSPYLKFRANRSIHSFPDVYFLKRARKRKRQILGLWAWVSRQAGMIWCVNIPLARHYPFVSCIFFPILVERLLHISTQNKLLHLQWDKNPGLLGPAWSIRVPFTSHKMVAKQHIHVLFLFLVV